MMINRSQLKFHETFQPEMMYISKLMDLAGRNYCGDKFEISDLTGIPTGKQKGKVEPHIKYATYMGLISSALENGKYSLALSTLGKEIFMQDQYLHESLTHWLCHYGISRQQYGAPQWSYLVHNGHSSFTQTNSSEFHLSKANTFFGTDISFDEMFGVVKRSYSDGCFSDINYVVWDDGVTYVEHNENPELLFAYAYVMLDAWQRLKPEKREITLIELCEDLGLWKVFNLCNEEIACVIDSLCYEGLISVNRQLFPATVIKTSTADNAISQLYSRLL